jgi:small subunit ribosomal protein S4
MARYTGPTTKKARAFGEAIFGEDKYFERRAKQPPGQHGATKKRKTPSNYSIQLTEKQKVKYMYGVLERQFRKTFASATRRKGVTGEILLQLLEARLDNTVYRFGISRTRRGARQLVGHRHITVNGEVVNIPSYQCKPGDKIAVRGRSKNMDVITDVVGPKTNVSKFPWLEWNPDKMEGVFIAFPERVAIPEKIQEQLIVELYSK